MKYIRWINVDNLRPTERCLLEILTNYQIRQQEIITRIKITREQLKGLYPGHPLYCATYYADNHNWELLEQIKIDIHNISERLVKIGLLRKE